MSALPQDDELTALLNDLDDTEDVEVPLLEPTKPIKPIKSIKPVEKPTEPELHVVEHEDDPEPPSGIKIDLNNLYSDSLQELLTNYRKDRGDIDKLINHLWERLNNNEPSRVFFETLAISLRTKSEANANLVKLLDSVSKRIDNTSGGVDGLDLEGLLDG